MSMTFFSQVLAGIVPKPDGFIIPVGDDWRQGRTVYGGLSAALCVECAIRSIPGLPPLRSAQFCFVGPATGELQIAPSLVRRGKTSTFVGAASANGPYRLPSEAEWEYAARAGATTKFYRGDDDAAAPVHAWFNANSGCEKVDGLFCDHGQTHPVGAKPPNAFGLYDMAGNVWQWTEDCYDNSYAGIPADGGANEAPSSDPQAKDVQGNCLRFDRGGPWMFPAWLLRPATRELNPADYRDAIMGFRVARSLAAQEQASPEPSAPRVVDLKASDGTLLKAT